MTTFTLGPAAAADATPIGLLSRTQIEDGLPRWTWTPARVSRAIAAADTLVVAARDASALAGFAIMAFGDEHAHLSLLAVLPSRRRRGLGSALMAWLEDSALVAGIATITLELRERNHAARAFYAARGFREEARLPGYYQGLEPALRMARDIRRGISNNVG